MFLMCKVGGRRILVGKLFHKEGPAHLIESSLVFVWANPQYYLLSDLVK